MRGWNKNIRVNVILDVFCMLTADELRASADTKEPRRLICQAACMKYSCYPAASGKWASFFDRVTLGKHFRLSSTTAGGLFRCEGGAISQICWTLSASLIGFQQPAVSKQMTSCCTYRIPCRDDPPTGEGGGGQPGGARVKMAALQSKHEDAEQTDPCCVPAPVLFIASACPKRGQDTPTLLAWVLITLLWKTGTASFGFHVCVTFTEAEFPLPEPAALDSALTFDLLFEVDGPV